MLGGHAHTGFTSHDKNSTMLDFNKFRSVTLKITTETMQDTFHCFLERRNEGIYAAIDPNYWFLQLYENQKSILSIKNTFITVFNCSWVVGTFSLQKT